MTDEFVYRSRMAASADAVYRFHAEPDALERLTPPWEKVAVISKTGGIEDLGSRVTLRVSIGPIQQTWVAEHTACEPDRMFQDIMLSGPFPFWKHTHRFIPESDSSSWLEDHVEFAYPLGKLGKWVAGWYIRRKLVRMFEWRHAATNRELAKMRGAQGNV